MSSKKEPHFNQVKMDWLATSQAHEFDTDKDDEYLDYPLPPEAGIVQGNMLKTSHNISVYHAKHHYNADVLGNIFQLGRLSGQFDAPVFMVGTVLGSQVEHQERIPECYVRYGEGITLFRHLDRFDSDTYHQTTKPFDVTFFSLPIPSLNLLIGQYHTEYLLSALEISTSPSTATHPIPLRITRILKAAVSPHLKGSMKKLYAQTKVLEYLCELFEYVEQKNGLLTDEQKLVSKAHEIYDYLNQLDGKLPTIAELAEQTDMSAHKLNLSFRDEFGMTIHRFMTKKRLEQAHAAILKTTIPLKAISIQLGYSHVNHFITAFKREFGYPPGRLRRN